MGISVRYAVAMVRKLDASHSHQEGVVLRICHALNDVEEAKFDDDNNKGMADPRANGQRVEEANDLGSE